MRLAVLLGAGLWLGACAGHPPNPTAEDRAQCLAAQAGRLGVGPDARATAGFLCSASSSNTLLAQCQDGFTGAPDGGCGCPRRLAALGPGVGCRLSEGPDWQDVPCGTPVDLCGTPASCTCE